MRQYYSRSANLVISAVKPEIVTLEGGRRVETSEKLIVFIPLTGGSGAGSSVNTNWGSFRTDDPQLIEFLDNRIANLKNLGELPDILTPEDWNKEIIPKDSQIKTLESEIQALRRRVSAGNEVAKIVDEQSIPEKRGTGRPGK